MVSGEGEKGDSASDSIALTGHPGPNGEEDQEENMREMANQRQMRERDRQTVRKTDRGRPEQELWSHGLGNQGAMENR